MAKVGLAKVGQHSKTLKLATIGKLELAKVGLAKVGQLRLAKVGQNFLAKVGLAKVGLSPYFCERPFEITSIWPKSLAWKTPWTCVARGRNLERRDHGRRADIEELEKMDASEIHAKKLHAQEVLTPMNDEKF